MVKIKLDDKEYILPEYLTIEQYSKIYKVKDLFSDDYFAAKLINIVTEIPLKDLLEADYQEVSYISAYLLSLLPMETPKFEDTFELDGIIYGFFPKWKDLTFAEFIDMDTISTKKPEELLNMLHILAAVMYRPIIAKRGEHDFDIEKYDVNTMVVRSELFKKRLNVKYILGAQFFFINFARRYSVYIQASSMKTFSIWTRMKLLWKLRRIVIATLFKRPLDGSSSSTELLTMILQNTNISTKKS
jgi:hypothetical protein